MNPRRCFSRTFFGALAGVGLSALLLAAHATAHSAAPPLPPGSEKVRVEPGIGKADRDRQAKGASQRADIRRKRAQRLAGQAGDTPPPDTSRASPFERQGR